MYISLNIFREKKQLEMKFVLENPQVQQVSHHEKYSVSQKGDSSCSSHPNLDNLKIKTTSPRSYSLVLGLYLKLLLFKMMCPHFIDTHITD